jgi:hypothetical protein
VNPFEALCVHAASRRWCWKLFCTTCGHGQMRGALRQLARGSGMARRRADGNDGPNPSEARTFTLEEQLGIQDAVVGCDVRGLAERVALRDWLGYIGLALRYTEEAEAANLKLTQALVPQLLRLVNSRSAASLALRRLLSEREPLTYSDLSEIEAVYAGPRPRSSEF